MTHSDQNVKESLNRLIDCKSVKGTIIIDKNFDKIINTQGEIFENDQGKRYAKHCKLILENIKFNLNELEGDDGVRNAFLFICSYPISYLCTSICVYNSRM